MEKPKFEFYTRPNGFTKKTQKTPSREIQRAKVIKKEYEEEQYANNKIFSRATEKSFF